MRESYHRVGEPGAFYALPPSAAWVRYDRDRPRPKLIGCVAAQSWFACIAQRMPSPRLQAGQTCRQRNLIVYYVENTR